MTAWEIVVGIETHAQLLTKSKMFSGASTAFGAPPNTQASAVDIALPGTLPVANRAAVEQQPQHADDFPPARRLGDHRGAAAGREVVERPAAIVEKWDAFFFQAPRHRTAGLDAEPVVNYRGGAAVPIDGSQCGFDVGGLHDLSARIAQR